MRAHLLIPVGLLLIVTCFGCDDNEPAAPGGQAPAQAPATSPAQAIDTPGAREAREAMQLIAATMRRGDAQALEELTYADDEPEAVAQRALLLGMVDLQGAAEARYGRALNDAYVSIPTEQQIDAMAFEINGDEAVSTLPGRPRTKLVREDGQWKLDMRAAAPADAALSSEVLRRLGETFRELAREVRAGGYPAIEDAHAELVRRTEQVLGAGPATAPSTKSERAASAT